MERKVCANEWAECIQQGLAIKNEDIFISRLLDGMLEVSRRSE